MSEPIDCIPLNIDWELEIAEDQEYVARLSYARDLDVKDFMTVRNDDIGGVDVYYKANLVISVQDDCPELGYDVGGRMYDFWNNEGVVWVHGIIHIINEEGDICRATSDDCFALNEVDDEPEYEE
jgi:hypothetical protein